MAAFKDDTHLSRMVIVAVTTTGLIQIYWLFFEVVIIKCLVYGVCFGQIRSLCWKIYVKVSLCLCVEGQRCVCVWGSFASGVEHPMDSADGFFLQVSSKASPSLLHPFITVKHVRAHTHKHRLFTYFSQALGFLITGTHFLLASSSTNGRVVGGCILCVLIACSFLVTLTPFTSPLFD